MVNRLVLSLGLVLAGAQSAFAGVFCDFAVLAETTASTGTNVHITGGLFGGGGDVFTHNGSSAPGYRTGGAFSSGTNVSVGADGVIADGNIFMHNGSSVAGDVHSGGNISTGTNVTFSGDVKLTGTYTPGGGTTPAVATPGAPTPFMPTALPIPHVFGSGGVDQITGNGGTLTFGPGSYGDLSTGTNATVNLSAGDYFFDSVFMHNGTDLNLDLTGGDLRIFVTGAYSTGTNVDATLINGTAANVHGESQTSWFMHNGGSWFGSLYTPNGPFSTGTNVEIVGSVYSGGSVFLHNGSSVDFVKSNHLLAQVQGPPTNGGGAVIPEPSSLLLFGFGGLGAGIVRRRKRAALA